MDILFSILGGMLNYTIREHPENHICVVLLIPPSILSNKQLYLDEITVALDVQPGGVGAV